MPVADLTNHVEFMGLRLISQPGTFRPKKQTEYLVTTALDMMRKNSLSHKCLNIIDMCTGIGNIAIVMALHLPKARIYGTDISEKAIDIACKNAGLYQLEQRISFITGDLFIPLEKINLKGKIDAIICNPPYIPTDKIKYLDASIIEHEPLNALDGGAFGLSYFMRVISDSMVFLKPSGILAFEVGGGQGLSVARLIGKKERYSEAKICPCPGSTEEIVSCSLLDFGKGIS
jgi:release factor glutamine methyltransferase